MKLTQIAARVYLGWVSFLSLVAFVGICAGGSLMAGAVQLSIFAGTGWLVSRFV